MSASPPHLEFRNLSAYYGTKQVLRDVSFTVPRNSVIGIIGPANSGKTTLLKTINRTLDFIPGGRFTGEVLLGGESVTAMRDPNALRRRIGMVFPLPVGLPLSVYENVAYAPRRMGVTDKGELDGIVERCLRQSVLWDEVKDRLNLLGTRLSGGQQQRLTLARALSLSPEILCLDEFSIAIDPVTTMRIEEVLKELRRSMTIVLVTNLVQQARRLADNTLFLWRGETVELSPTEVAFSDTPRDRRTYDYVNGIFG
ncbi:MAG TPA: phosphate ABC transporter ATP-binding protein [Verrucomicrobiales bacterium]|nr:phosphate ABC transporter ATP-binding protein [Verrucomicrobiales bacterium]